MNLQNLQQNNGMLFMIKMVQTILKEMIQALNLRQKNIIQMHIFL